MKTLYTKRGNGHSAKRCLFKPSALSHSVSAALGAVLLGGFTPVASAQDNATLEEVVITGSRIVRRDFESNSPITTVDAADLETQTGLNLESYLNQLPEYNPANSPVTSQGDVQITPVNSVGIASISLRGFGPNRSLVLVNGKRPTPINALMVTDINGVPGALIERVETITGGASAVYGADAVGGVTNFILRTNFEGFEVDSQFGTTEAGDGDEYRVSAVMGANFADGRGNVTMGLEQYVRGEALEIERDIYTEDRWNNPLAGGGLFLQGINGYNCLFNCPADATLNGVFANRPAGTDVLAPSPFRFFTGYNFNSDGTIWVAGSEAGQSKAKLALDGEYALSRGFDNSIPNNPNAPREKIIDTYKWNNTRAFVSAPQDRWSFFANGSFDLSDDVNMYVRSTFAESETETLLFGTNAIFGWEGTVPFNPTTDSPIDPTLNYRDTAVVAAALANPAAFANPNFIGMGQAGVQHPVPVELAALLMGRGNPTGDWQPNWNPDDSLPPRSTFNTNTVWQVETGFNIDLPVKDWTLEAYYSHGESSTYNNAAGNMSLSRYRALIREPGYGAGAVISGNATGQSRGFGAADITCTSGFYNTFFAGDAPLSQDCFDAVNATLQTKASNTQDIIELNLQGALAQLPAGEARYAAGYQKRRNSARFVPDILQSTTSFLDQVVGVYPTGSLDASTSVDDYYVEALVPLLSGLPGVDMLELELGARFSDYSETDEETTWKALANWQINDWARVRGGFNRATRAPNIGELFLNRQEIFQVGGNNFGDPCGLRSTAPYGAGGSADPTPAQPGEQPPLLAAGNTIEQANSTRLICEAVMTPAAVNQYYSVSNAGGGGGGAFNWVNQEGNPNLESETADTWTLGVVARAPSDNPWLEGLNVALDYYRVEIEEAIMLYSVDTANFRCFGEVFVSNASEAAAQAASPACQLVPRNQALGGPLTTAVSYDNQATIETAGLDVAINWNAQLNDIGFDLPGGLGLSLSATILDYYRTKQSPASFDVETDWAGSLGPNLSGTNPGAYDFRLFGNISYFMDNWSVNFRWRHLPEVNSANYASQQAIIRNNANVSAGGDGVILSYTPLTEIAADSYNIFDMSFNWNVNETFTVRGGITNLFDAEPETIDNAGFAVGTNLGSVCGGAAGCINPTAYSLPSIGGYNGGYYDTLGRRFFVGLKATF